jgi:hypothetical protein
MRVAKDWRIATGARATLRVAVLVVGGFVAAAIVVLGAVAALIVTAGVLLDGALRAGSRPMTAPAPHRGVSARGAPPSARARPIGDDPFAGADFKRAATFAKG